MKIIINKKDHKLLRCLVEDEFWDLVATCDMFDERLKLSDLPDAERLHCEDGYRRAFFKAGYLGKLLKKLGD